MSRSIYPLLVAQFLSAFADNAILFTVIALVMKSEQLAGWYVPALQSAFLVAFVILAPWAGAFSDRHAKANVLITANCIKAVGAGLLLVEVEPLLAYCLVGMGAALYSPAKYGLLPELTEPEELVKANSWIEGSTIFAILLGMVVGAKVADYSIEWALVGTMFMFVISAGVSWFLPKRVEKPNQHDSTLKRFYRQMQLFFTTPRSRFSVLGASLFWAAAATIRVIIIAWAPLILMTENASDIAELTLFLAIGIIVGSAVVPHLIPLNFLRRARIPAYLMSIFIIGLSFTGSLWPARMALFAIGAAGGMFIVPVNAALQELGHNSIGSGGAVALQGFFQNLAMLVAVGSYTYAASLSVSPVSAMQALGVLLMIATLLVSYHLPNNDQSRR